jgi:hypothetical protein
MPNSEYLAYLCITLIYFRIVTVVVKKSTSATITRLNLVYLLRKQHHVGEFISSDKLPR